MRHRTHLQRYYHSRCGIPIQEAGGVLWLHPLDKNHRDDAVDMVDCEACILLVITDLQEHEAKKSTHRESHETASRADEISEPT